MTKTSKSMVSIFLVMVMFFVGAVVALSNPQKVYANVPTNDYTDTIYYFTDFYPSLNYNNVLNSWGSNYTLVCDRQEIDSVEFEELVTSDYFDCFGQNCIVIIDIKTFKPSADILLELFEDLKEDQDCITLFISLYDEDDYVNNGFLNYVDVFSQTDFNKLEKFCEESIEHFTDDNLSYLVNNCYILDENLIDISNYSGPSFIDDLCANSIFLTHMLDALKTVYGIPGNTYGEILTVLNNFNIKLFVPTGDGQLQELTTGQMYPMLSVAYLLNEENNYNIQRVSAVGFWHLSSELYNFLYDSQYIDGQSAYVYVMEVDRIHYSPNGLAIYSDTDLEVTDDIAEDIATAMAAELGL